MILLSDLVRKYGPLKRRKSGAAVYALQNMLNTQADAGLDLDGRFGALTEAALGNFQQANGIAAYGECDVQTAEILDAGARRSWLASLTADDLYLEALRRLLTAFGMPLPDIMTPAKDQQK